MVPVNSKDYSLAQKIASSRSLPFAAKTRALFLVPCLLLLCSITLAQEGWVQVNPTIPWMPRIGAGVLTHDGKLWAMGGGLYNGRAMKSDVWCSSDGVTWERLVERAPWSPRHSIATASFKGRLWVAGGINAEYRQIGDLWSSEDGKTWKEMPIPPWYDLKGRQLVVFKDKLWALGGDTHNVPQLSNDVWYTEDGETWLQATKNVPWSYRFDFAVEAFAGKLWVMGGEIYNLDTSNEVWSSEDGIHWESSPDDVPWTERSGMSSTIFNGQLWMTGGESGYKGRPKKDEFFNEAWVTSDGHTWQAAPKTPWAGRYKHYTVAFKDRLWVYAGLSSVVEINDVWSTGDGISWEPALPQRWGPRGYHTTVEHEGYMWVIGGRGSPEAGPNATREVWKSKDGISWALITDEAPWQFLLYSKAISFKGRIWIIGGITGRDKTTIFWSSADGENWRREDDPPWPNRKMHALAVHDNKLWIVGGYTDAPTDRNRLETWFSEDGKNWVEASSLSESNKKSAPGPGPRMNHACFSLNGKLWVLGGDEHSSKGDIWSTSDGLNWTLEVDEAPFGITREAQVLEIEDRVLLVGGAFPYADRGNDGKSIWVSTNGTQWHPYPAESAWRGYQEHSTAVALDRKIWMLGPPTMGSSRSNDIWMFDPSTATARATPVQPVKPELHIAAAVIDVKLNEPDLVKTDWTSAPVSAMTPPIDRSNLFVHDGKLWLEYGGVYYWTMVDESTWMQVPGFIPLPEEKEYTVERFDYRGTPQTVTVVPRPAGQLVIHGDTAWLINDGRYGDSEIWKSTNGNAWELVTMGYIWTTDEGETVAFNDKLWYFAGGRIINSNVLGPQTGEVWSSEDGAEWSMLTDKAPWQYEGGCKPYVFQNQLWAIGASPDKIWTSSDGINWSHVQTTSENPLIPKYGSIFPLKDRLWLIGDLTAPTKSIWSSPDGKSWDREVESISLPSRRLFNGIEHDGKLWIVSSAMNEDRSISGDGVGLWSLDKSENWIKYKFAEPWHRGENGIATAHRDQLYVFASSRARETAPLSRVYASKDGTNWDLKADSPKWGPRFDASVVSHSDRLWLVGGYGGPENPDKLYNDVYYLPDGSEWTLATANANWNPRRNAACVSFKDRLVLLGGRDESTRYADVWVSQDGIQWKQVVERLPFRVPDPKSVVVFDDKIWAIGVRAPAPGKRVWTSFDGEIQIWNSADGISWNQIKTDETWPKHLRLSAQVHAGRIWLAGNSNDEPISESSMHFYHSADGVTWTEATDRLSGDPSSTHLLSVGGRFWALDKWSQTVSYMENYSGK